MEIHHPSFHTVDESNILLINDNVGNTSNKYTWPNLFAGFGQVGNTCDKFNSLEPDEDQCQQNHDDYIHCTIHKVHDSQLVFFKLNVLL